MSLPVSPKQLEFILNSTAHWNLAHGSVRSGKTIATIFRFIQAIHECPDSSIYIAGHTFDTAYRNVVKPIMESPELALFTPFCTWSGKKLYFKDKVITLLGAKDEGAVKNFQGDTYSLIYCNEMALYPPSIISMIDTRLSRPHSQGFADMNPEHPEHPLKKWIDEADNGNPHYYALHFRLEDNPYLTQEYKDRIRKSLTGVFYKRNYLGLWCMAEGAIFDFFDREMAVVSRPPRAANYWIAGIDYGTHNNFSCLLIGVSTGIEMQKNVQMWVEKEYVWNPAERGRQKTNLEYADDVEKFLEPYGVKLLYMDPSALSFKLEMQRKGFRVVDANNAVFDGISFLASALHSGKLVICSECKSTIKEIESYVWDKKAAERGLDRPLKKDDHCIDALRYAVYTHRPQFYDPYAQTQSHQQWLQNRYEVPSSIFR